MVVVGDVRVRVVVVVRLVLENSVSLLTNGIGLVVVVVLAIVVVRWMMGANIPGFGVGVGRHNRVVFALISSSVAVVVSEFKLDWVLS